MLKSLRPLLPASGGPSKEEDTPAKGAPLKRRRSAVPVACNSCRARKSACDGKRPACSSCEARGLACAYVSATPSETHAMAVRRENETLKRDYSTLAELVDALRDGPEDRAIELLRTIRLKTTDPAALLSPIKAGGLRTIAWPQLTLTYPPAQDGLEFQLMLRHAMAYPTLVPLDATAVGIPSLLTPAVIGSSDAEIVADGTLPQPGLPQKSQATHLAKGAAADLSTTSRAYCDSRLALLKIGCWSRVEIADSLAAALISLYLETDHPTLGLFDADLFLTDLISHRARFCSPLLVSSLLSWACHAHSTFDSETLAIGQAFFAEADALWQGERMVDSLPTVAAAQFLSLNAIYDGDDGGLPYLREGVEMARRMRLLGSREPGEALGGHGQGGHEYARASSHTAWGVFNWITMRSVMFQMEEPALKFPPTPSPPGSAGHLHPDEAPEDSTPTHDLPRYMGQTFPALCQFWLLTSEWAAVYYVAGDTPVPDRVPVEYAHQTFQKLLAWADSLHVVLARGDQSPHHCIILHIWYHASIIQIFRPFALIPTGSAWLVSAASLHQLKHLIIVFRSTYQCADYAIFWHVALLLVANAVLKNTDDPEWHSYLTLCINGYADLFCAFRVTDGIVRGLLSIAHRIGVLSTAEAQSMLNGFRAKGIHHINIQNISATFIVDLDLALAHPEAARLHTPTEGLDDLSLFEEFTMATETLGMVDTASPTRYGAPAP